MLKRNRLHLALTALLTLSAAAPAFGQNTSAAMTGRVVDASGQPVAGATVEIVHEPSGTRRSVVTDAEGRYSTRGLRVGGPYTVEANVNGQTAEKEQVFLLLAETSTVDLAVAGGDAQELAVVEVTASASATIFTPDNMGSGSNVTREQIEAFPSISRSIQDYIRLDPRLVQTDKERGEISAGGHPSQVLVRLACGAAGDANAPVLLARITARAAAQLALAAGMRVWAQVKSAALVE